ncbi:hypothetical protein T4D_15367 [Trichinella pseudospiralis]|uniref:Uncharacterized protein n=1 Tax=Trichinella pseudospiralis TaxID=6337 RepID=A0A0V1FD75_TRIPS|nr:hypothetical protein T4D_15367 [Trichinella pseudospiralis]
MQHKWSISVKIDIWNYIYSDFHRICSTSKFYTLVGVLRLKAKIKKRKVLTIDLAYCQLLKQGHVNATHVPQMPYY